MAYAPLWDVGWSWDDEALVVDNQITGSLHNWREFFTRDLWGTTRLETLKSGYYRPFMLLSLAFDRAIFGLSAAAAHAHNLIWHLLATTTLYALLMSLIDRKGPVLAATALFALHPVQSEVLALVAARNDSMAATFVLLSLWLLQGRTVNMWRLVAAGMAILAGLLSKESAVLAVVMLLVLDLARWKRPGSGLRYLPFVVAGMIYMGLRSLADLNHAIVPEADNYSLVAKHGLDIAALYGKLLIWPWPLTPARHVHYLPPLAENLFGLVIFTGLIALAFTRGRNKILVTVGFVWAALALAPTLAATLDKGLLGERYLYLPMAGLALAFGSALYHARTWWIFLAILPCVLTLQLRLPHWQDSRTVWEHAHSVAPSPFTAAGLAWYYNRDSDLDLAMPLLVMALDGDPPYRDVCDLIIQAHIQGGEIAEAARLGKWAIDERGCPPNGLIREHYAVALAATGQWQSAARIAMARPSGPQGPGLVVIGAARVQQGDFESVQRAAQAMTDDPTFLSRVAKLLVLGGEPEKADALLRSQTP